MKKEVKNKKITVDVLARMMANSFDKMEKNFETLTLEVKGVKNQLEDNNKRLDDIVLHRVHYDVYNKLETRVEFIEKKLEIKN